MNEPLYMQWLAAKQAETAAIELRRSIEDAILTELNYQQTEGTTNYDAESGVRIKVVSRTTDKVDYEKLQKLIDSSENPSAIKRLFRFKAEPNKGLMYVAEPDILESVKTVISSTIGRPSITIQVKE